MIPVRLLSEESVIIETLERIGIINKQEKIIFPSCYLYQDDASYYIAHFKELIVLFNEEAYNNFNDIDQRRRDSIAVLLESWNMLDILSDKEFNTLFVNILPFPEKIKYKIVHKFIQKVEDESN